MLAQTRIQLVAKIEDDYGFLICRQPLYIHVDGSGGVSRLDIIPVLYG